MALSPIQIFSKGNENSLQAILAGGNNVISGIMNQAIQIGRDISNKQLAQERDLLGMRAQETALAQRRVENRQQDYEDAKNFSRRAFESDRAFGANRSDAAFNQNRTTAQDIFGNSVENRRLNLTEDRYAAQDAERTRLEEERLRAQKEFDGNEPKFPEVGDMPTDPTMVLPPKQETPQDRVKQDTAEILGRGVDAEGNVTFAPKAATPTDVLAPVDSAPAPEGNGREFDLRVLAHLVAQSKDKNLRPDQRTKAAGDAAVLEDRLKTTSTGRSSSKVTDPAEEAAKGFVFDETAFPSQRAGLARSYGGADKIPKDKLLEAETYDKNKFESEKQSALNYPRDKYISLGGKNLSEPQKKKRGELWDYANKKAGAPSSTGAVSSIPGI